MSCDDEADRWVHAARRRDLLTLIAEVASAYRCDETLQDAKRRALMVMWLSTRGDLGAWCGKVSPAEFLANL
jgi:hypothetical protein